MPDKDQASTLDYVIDEDDQLEEALRERLANSDAAATFGRAGKAIKSRMTERYPSMINSDDDGEHSGWVRCGSFRFRPRNKYHAKEAVEFDRGEGYDWPPFDIERLAD